MAGLDYSPLQPLANPVGYLNQQRAQQNQVRLQDLALKQQEQQATLGQFIQPAISGNKAALSEIFNRSPELGMKIMEAQQPRPLSDLGKGYADVQSGLLPQQYFDQKLAMDNARASELADKANVRKSSIAYNLTNQVLSAPPQNRQQAYRQALESAQQAGLDVSSFPMQYDEALVSRINQGSQMVLQSQPKGTSLSVGADGKVEFTQGGYGLNQSQPVQKSVEKDLQKDLISTTDSLQRAATIGARYKSEFLTYGGQLGAASTRIQEKMGLNLSSEQKDFLKDRTKFNNLVAREFNAYRKEITGAAAAVAELESLKKAVINTDQSPSEFEASLQQYQDDLQRALRLKRALIREGITVGSKEFGSQFDSRFLSGGDDSIEARISDFQGETDSNKIQAILEQEGYRTTPLSNDEMGAAPASTKPSKTFQSTKEATAAIDRGDVLIGDTVIVNGKKFRIDP
jgi:hypothetical protein